MKYMDKIFRQLYGNTFPEDTPAEKILSQIKSTREEVEERLQLLDSVYQTGEVFIANEFGRFLATAEAMNRRRSI